MLGSAGWVHQSGRAEGSSVGGNLQPPTFPCAPVPVKALPLGAHTRRSQPEELCRIYKAWALGSVLGNVYEWGSSLQGQCCCLMGPPEDGGHEDVHGDSHPHPDLF